MIFSIGSVNLLKLVSMRSREREQNTTGGRKILSRDFKEFIELLNSNDVRYLVIGGYALAFYGKPRYTKDLDIWLECSEDNAQRERTSKQSTGRLQDLADVESLAGIETLSESELVDGSS